MKLLLGYKNNTSFIHKLDPRIKLLWLLGNLFFIAFFQKIWLLLLCLGLTLLSCYVAGIALKEFIPLLKIMSVMGLQFIFLQGIFSDQGQVLFHIWEWPFYLGGLLVGVKGILILFNLVLLCLQFMMWTSPEEFTLLLVKFKVPHKYASLVGLALHFLPVMEKELKAIYASQQSRGLELSTLWQKIKALLPIILPLTLRALHKSSEIALAMELKGYTLYPKRTFLQDISFVKLDYIAGIALLTYFSFLLYIIAPVPI